MVWISAYFICNLLPSSFLSEANITLLLLIRLKLASKRNSSFMEALMPNEMACAGTCRDFVPWAV